MIEPVPGLRDIHLPASPGWWPPAPGWWILAGLVVWAIAWWLWRKPGRPAPRREIEEALREFDAAIQQAVSPTSRLAAASAQLRRAARLRDPAAATLEGEAWLRFLDGGHPDRAFSNGAGVLLVDGAFRRSVEGDDVDGALTLARRRFATLLATEPAGPAHA